LDSLCDAQPVHDYLSVLHFAVQSRKTFDLCCVLHYTPFMKPKSEVLQIRISSSEKEGFELAAVLAGISLSSWVRERLRLTAIRELEGAGRRVPFVPEIPMGGSSNART
jgi:predicted HicB family RNase H-like nuclease